MDELTSFGITDEELDAAWDETSPEPEDFEEDVEGTDAETEPEEPGVNQPEDEEGSEEAAAEGGDTPEEVPEGEPAAPPEPAAPEEAEEYRLQFMGEEVVVKKDRIKTLAQKGLNHERMEQKLEESEKKTSELEAQAAFLREMAARAGQSVDVLMNQAKANWLAGDEGVTPVEARQRLAQMEETARLTAERDRLAGEARQREGRESESDAERQRQEAMRRDFQEFIAAYPGVDINRLPPEVWEGVKNGKTLVNAYGAHFYRQRELELEAREKALENKEKSTGSVETKGAEETPDEIDRWWYDGT